MAIIRHGILTRSGWFPYGDHQEFKDPQELEKAARLAPSIPLIPFHPDGGFADKAQDVIGLAYNRYDPQAQGIRTLFEFFEDRLTPEQATQLRTGQQIGVSPGFTCNLVPYGEGFKQTDLLLNHGAVLFEGEPRCPLPNCGITDAKPPKQAFRVQDSLVTLEGCDLPGGSFEACVAEMMEKGRDEESAKRICGALAKKDVLGLKSGKAIGKPCPKLAQSLSQGVSENMSDKPSEPDKPDKDYKARIDELQHKLEQSDALVKTLEPLAEGLRKTLAATGTFTVDELKTKSVAELLDLKRLLDAQPRAHKDTIGPPLAPTTTSMPGMQQLPGGLTVIESTLDPNRLYKYKDRLPH